MPDFKQRYLLGEGYPYLLICDDGEGVGLTKTRWAGKAEVPGYEEALDNFAEMPRYQLVLERLDDIQHEHEEESDE